MTFSDLAARDNCKGFVNDGWLYNVIVQFLIVQSIFWQNKAKNLNAYNVSKLR